MTNKNNKITVGILGFAAFVAGPVLSQDAGGRMASLSISQDLRWSDNIDFDSSNRSGAFSRTDLGFSLTSATRTDELSLAFGGAIDAEFADETSISFVSPFVTLAYGQETRSASFSANASYRNNDISSLVAAGIDPGSGLTFVVEDEGRREDIAAEATFAFGLNAPFGGGVVLSYSQTDYSDTADPDLLDISRSSIDGNLRFDLTPTLRLVATGRYGTVDEDGVGSIDQTEQRLSFGVEADVRPGFSVGASVDYSRVESIGGTALAPIDRLEEGAGLALNAAMELQNGTLSGEISSRVGEAGRVTTASVTRSLEMRRGNVDLTFGLTETETGDLNPTYGIGATRELRQGEIGLSLSQVVNTSVEGNESLDSSITLDYRQQLTNAIGLGASLALADTRELAGDVDDATRLDATVSVSHALNRDWDLVGGYTYSRLSEEGSDDVTSNTVFVGVSRTFDWRW